MSKNINMEKIKKSKKDIDILADIYFHAVFGERISHEDLERFKWCGIYAQDLEQNFFTVKIPLDLGKLNIEQLKTISTISEKFTQDTIFFSSEQKVEFKNLKIHNIPEIFNLLKQVNLNTFFEAGHTVRRVLTCPVNGIDSTQIYDVESLATKLNETFVGNKNFSNLPNKLDIAISGYIEGCDVGFIPDVSFNATKDLKEKIVFSVNILDRQIGFISPSQLINTTRAIANIYKDFGNREEIEKSTFEYLIKDLGFDGFFNILNSMIDYKIQKSINIIKEENPRKPRFGINKSKIEGKSYIGCRIKENQISSKNITTLSNLLEKYEATNIKITHKGNLIILDVPSENAEILADELVKINFNPFI